MGIRRTQIPYGDSVRGLLLFLLGALLVPAVAAESASGPKRFEIEVETGPVWQNRNDVEIPNDGTATRFSLEDLAGTGPWPAVRFQFGWNINDRHGLRLLLAPLSYTETGTFDRPVIFVDETYAANTPTEGTYRFNSWRVGYRYRFWKGKRWRWWIGGTAKVRDAKIELRQGSTSSKDTDLGFVPLLYLRGDYAFRERWHLQLEADALGGGPGRAEDVSVKLAYDIGDRWTVAGGYRTVEGGVDIDEVYNFAWFNHAAFSFSYRWGSFNEEK